MSLIDTNVELPQLTRLGTSYSSLTNVQPQFESGVVRLISCPVSAVSVVFWMALTAVVLLFFAYLSWPQAAVQMGWLAVPFFITITGLALFCPVAMALIHNSNCSRLNPLIEIDLNQNLVSLRNGRKTLPLASVHSLIAASLPDSEGGRQVELQLLIHSNATVVAELVCTKYNSSSRRAFGNVLSAISHHCPFPTLLVEPNGFFRRGPLTVTKV